MIGPVIICDKSTLQGLSRGELNMLRRYYRLNIPPVLCIEILADLKKFGDTDRSRLEVERLAKKIVPFCSTVNAPLRPLLIGELMGGRVTMNNVPIFMGVENVVSPENKRGAIIREAEELQALRRWQHGEFRAAEMLLAGAWREYTSSIDLEAAQRYFRRFYSPALNLQTFKAVAEHVDSLMQSLGLLRCASWLLYEIGVSPGAHRGVILKLLTAEPGQFAIRYPFAGKCIRTAMFFHFALAFGLVTTKATNRVDLEYLYYLPFCMVFTSGDKFFHAITKHLISSEQVFVKFDELKDDLKGLAEWWAGLTESERTHEMSKTGPPENESSLTHRLWQKFMVPGYRQQTSGFERAQSGAMQNLGKHVAQMLNSSQPQTGHGLTDVNDMDFIVRESEVALDGPCICGSDQAFKNCCGKYFGVDEKT